MSDILDIMRDFMLFTQKIERDMYETVKKLQLPDELDIYITSLKRGQVVPSAVCMKEI